MKEKKEGLLIVISGPSGAGKGTVFNAVSEMMPNLKKSISVTTREPREGEVDGVHYHFRTIEEYQDMIAKGEFLETAEVYCNYYGTPKKAVLDMLANGYDVMFELDTLGTKQIKARYPKCVTMFLMTPSLDELSKRLQNRNTETATSLKRRLDSARRELGECESYDYIVFNDSVKEAIADVMSIIRAERRRVVRNKDTIKNLIK